MKAFIAIAIVLFAFSFANAVTVRIVGQDRTVLFETGIKTAIPTDVGDASILAFDYNHVPYLGSAQGIAKIFDLGQDLQIISDSEMKAYGWCFAIDGITPDSMPDKTPVIKSTSIIEWYYAYAHYKNGTWINQCVRD